MEAPSPNTDPSERRGHLASVRLLVVKIGTNVLTRESGEVGLARIHALIEQVVDLRREGYQVILVSSGAISMGMDRLGVKKRPTSLPDKQACAAIGQIRLMSIYEQAFGRYGLATAQVLLTEDDFANRVRYLNLRNTVHRLLDHGVIPIINENDTVSTSEIETSGDAASRKTVFGDNDRLSALVMSKLGADLLVVLSDVDGLYPWTVSPATSSAPPIPIVREITPEIEAMCRAGNPRGRGGMLSKIQSIRVALESGGIAAIANGNADNVLRRILAGEPVGTLFLPRRKIPSRKRWIAYASSPAGRVIVNAGARQALTVRQSSLLFAGVVAVEAEFKRGDVVTIADESGAEIGRGIVNYSAKDARPLLGKRSSEVLELAGQDYEELIHRDNIVLWG